MSVREYDSQQQQQQNSPSFKVFIRVRPFSHHQQLATTYPNATHNYLTYNQSQIFLKLKTQTQCFTFDRIYTPEASQQQIFSSVANDIIDNAFIGVNGTIFCYGQTASGKTHTIVGDYKMGVEKDVGLLPRILTEVIRRKDDKTSNQSNLDIRIKISMIQIYNQKVIDLFDLSKRDLKLRQNKKQGVFIEFVTQQYVVNAQQAMSYVNLGLQNRTVGRTNMNEYSSRSHMVFMITVHETNFHTKEGRSAKITLTDLAGNEKIDKAGVQGKMLIQAKKINTSLSTLGKVIKMLSESKASHIPYRESKLTRLLQESIGGNSLTRLIINVSPSSLNQYETITSLRFGSRAKLIKNKPKTNKQYTIEQLQVFLEKAELKIKQQMRVIEELKQGRMGRFDRRNGGYSGLRGIERSITMHMIGDDDGDCDETLSNSNYSQAIVKSTVSNRDKCGVSMFGDTEMVSDQTLQFNIDGQSQEKKIRKPTLSLSKSLKVFPMLDHEHEGLKDNTLHQGNDKHAQRTKKSQKSVKIVQNMKFNQQKDHNQNKLAGYDLKMSTTISQQQMKQQLTEKIKQELKGNLKQELRGEIISLKQTIQRKDQQVAELKEKYKAKKSQINKEINKLKNFWLNLP